MLKRPNTAPLGFICIAMHCQYMAAGDTTLGFQADEDVVEDVEEFQDRHGFDSRSDAHRELTKIGLREVRSPIVYRIRQRAFDAGYYLTLVAAVIGVVGMVSDAIGPTRGVQIGLVILSIAVAPIAIIECIRAVRGQSQLGYAFRGDSE